MSEVSKAYASTGKLGSEKGLHLWESQKHEGCPEGLRHKWILSFFALRIESPDILV